MTIKIALVNLKGGSTKTTSSGYLLAAFHEAGLNPIGVDCDGENESLQEWQALADLPFPVITLATHNVHQVFQGAVGDDRFGVAVFDTPPMQAQRGTVSSVLRLVDLAVIVLGPTGIEYARVSAIRDLIEDVAPLRPDGKPTPAVVLLTKCPGYPAKSPKTYRDRLTNDGLQVLTAQVGRSDQYAQAWGTPLDRALSTPYGDAAIELLDIVNHQAVSA
jgi:chromosome partitioning protein